MPSEAKIALFGVPFDANSSYMRGAAEAPAKIREAFQCDSSNTWSENGYDIAKHLRDLGDVEFEGGKDATGRDPLDRITAFAVKAFQDGSRAIALGGDHSITYGIIKAVAQVYSSLTILH